VFQQNFLQQPPHRNVLDHTDIKQFRKAVTGAEGQAMLQTDLLKHFFCSHHSISFSAKELNFVIEGAA
jgi:hypothetical protein